MISIFKSFLKKNKHAIKYCFFGLLTTIVNCAIFYSLHNYFCLSASLSNSVAWVVAVLFAFLTNKRFVFQSKEWVGAVVIPELLKFAAFRIISGVVETAILLITVDILHWNGNIWKIIVSVFVIILNYIGSKFIVFKNQTDC